MAKNERVYLVGGSRMTRAMQSTWLIGESHTVVHSDPHVEPPLSGLDEAIRKKARIAAVNLRRKAITKGGLTGEEVIVKLRKKAEEMLIVTFSEDIEDQDSKMPEVDHHIHRERDMHAYADLAVFVTKSKRREVTVTPNRIYL